MLSGIAQTPLERLAFGTTSAVSGFAYTKIGRCKRLDAEHSGADAIYFAVNIEFEDANAGRDDAAEEPR
jgi:hypothetical protein